MHTCTRYDDDDDETSVDLEDIYGVTGTKFVGDLSDERKLKNVSSIIH